MGKRTKAVELTTAKVKAIKEVGVHGDSLTPTLFLRVSPGGSRSWIQRLVIRGRRTDLGLGGYPVTTLAEAREAALHNRRVVKQGGDPLGERKQRDAVPTFEEALPKVIALHEGTWKDKGRTREHWENSMRDYVLPVLGRRRVSDIEARDVLRIIGPLWTAKHETALKIKRRVSAVLQWAVVNGYRIDNPVNAIKLALPKADGLKGHFKAIHYQDVAAAIEKVKAGPSHWATIAAFEFSIYTATRSQEVRGLTWDELDLKAGAWELPGARTKTGKPYRIPLSTAAVDLLKEAKARSVGGSLVFPSIRNKMLSDSTVSKAVREAGIEGVPHAIARACFKTWASECTNADHAVIESCLNHSIGGALEKAYNRGDFYAKRARLMQAWADFLSGRQADVIQLHG